MCTLAHFYGKMERQLRGQRDLGWTLTVSLKQGVSWRTASSLNLREHLDMDWCEKVTYKCRAPAELR